jgi:chemotaxis signal transduction protein
MMAVANPASTSFVLLRVGERRFAFPASIVTELAPPVRLHTFPHASPLLTGVIVRRARIIPVYDAGAVLTGKRMLSHRFYLIARREFGKATELSAIPVDGECELATGEMQPPSPGQPSYVTGTVQVRDEMLDVLDLEALVTSEPAQSASQLEPEAQP